MKQKLPSEPTQRIDPRSKTPEPLGGECDADIALDAYGIDLRRLVKIAGFREYEFGLKKTIKVSVKPGEVVTKVLTLTE